MGWGRMLMLGDWGQQMDIEDRRREIPSMKRKMRSMSSGRANTDLKRRIDTLENENDGLRPYLASLVRYLSVKRILDPGEFREIVEIIDAEDGAADGGFKGEIVS